MKHREGNGRKDKPSSSMSCIVGSPTSSTSLSDTVWNETSAYWARFAHRKTPTLSTCEVAKKSFVGENERLVATLGVLNASINRPVGISNVRMTESRDAATSQRESGEKVYPVPLSRWRGSNQMQNHEPHRVSVRGTLSVLSLPSVSRCPLSERRGHHISQPADRCLGAAELMLRRTAIPRRPLVGWCGNQRTERKRVSEFQKGIFETSHVDGTVQCAGNYEPVQSVSCQTGDASVLRLLCRCGSSIEPAQDPRRARPNIKLLPLQPRLHVPHVYQPSRCARQTEVSTRRNAHSLIGRYAIRL